MRLRIPPRQLLLLVGVVALPATAALAPPQEAAEEGDQRNWQQPTPLPGRKPSRPLPAERRLPEQPLELRSRPVLIAGPAGPELLHATWRVGERDQIELLRLSSGRGDRPLPARTLLPEPAEVLDPTAIRGLDGRLIAAWTQLVDGRPRIVVQVAGGTPDAGAPRLATTTGRAEGRPALAVCDGRPWLAWECDSPPDAAGRSTRQLLLAPLDEGGAAAPPIEADPAGASAREPALAAHGSTLWLAWSRCDGDDREVVARPFAADRREFSAAPISISTDADADDRHVTLAIAPDGTPWFAWDRIAILHRFAPAPCELWTVPFEEVLDVSVQCACLRDGAVLRPRAADPSVPPGLVAGASLLTTGGGRPRLVFDHAGRLWIALRELEQKVWPNGQIQHYGFPLVLQHLGADGWSAPFALEDSGGPDEPAALLADGDGVLVAAAVDHRLRRGEQVRTRVPAEIRALAARGLDFDFWVGPGTIAIGRATSSAPVVLPPLERLTPVPAAKRPFRAPAASSAGRQGARFEAVCGERRLLAWYGDLHRHSHASTCSRGVEPTPDDRLEDGRDLLALDFMAMTDHDASLDPGSFWRLDKMTWAHQSPGFVPLAGYEWSTRSFGHVNVVRAGRHDLPTRSDEAWGTLRRQLDPRESLVIPHHAADRLFGVDFAAMDDDAVRLLEVFQACRGSYEFDGCFLQSSRALSAGSFAHDALKLGRRVGFIASTDHGYGASFAGVLAERCDRATLFEALRARRTFGATTHGLFIDFRVDGALMGEETAGTGPAKLTLRAHGTAPLADVVVFRDGERFREAMAQPELPANRLAPIVLEIECEGREKESALIIEVRSPDSDSPRFIAWQAPVRRRRPSPLLRFVVAEADPASARLEAEAGAEESARLHCYCTGDPVLSIRGATDGGAASIQVALSR
jgi:hypothetical protein